MKRTFLVLFIVLGMPFQASGSDIIQRMWENDVSPLCAEEKCVEVAMGTYLRNGVEKPFTFLHRSWKEKDVEQTAVRLEFLRGDKYVILASSQTRPRQLAILPDVDPDRPRLVSPSMYEELRETNINPLFLTLSLHLLHYREEVSNPGEMRLVMDERKAPYPLPHEIRMRVEERGGLVAPVEVVMYREGTIIFTARMKNAPANDRLRPFEIIFTAHGKTDTVAIKTWGLIPIKDYFGSADLGHGELNLPLIISGVPCPQTICS